MGSAARVYRVEPESEALTAAEYLRAQADLTQTWIDTDAARALNPADVATSKDIAAATLEVLAELERLRDELRSIALLLMTDAELRARYEIAKREAEANA